ncbi:hypothetical protein THASP1DRAFT_27258 [Thamnocephalis sphaerospora]|uniref:Uncharacterized protein n=1 Tax=Thamnocephalis sphaerospora TaxID=78915 RepID=A0A4V1IXG2_9FUNG|nr:hypothetical protein THASP1DRAFT_27258 [Thamnocephalis sphaerospora]|eukprot:RKP10949.1 hypothetical protein THASP1DRAFT_27258 [Thamnocephalis sphaerospora]
MGLLDRIKSSYVYTNWKVGRYTKRRRSLVPEFDERTADFYERNYRNGDYLHQEAQRRRMSYDMLGSATVPDAVDRALPSARPALPTLRLEKPITEEDEGGNYRRSRGGGGGASYRFGDESDVYYQTDSDCSVSPTSTTSAPTLHRRAIQPPPARTSLSQPNSPIYALGSSRSRKVDTQAGANYGAVVPYAGGNTAPHYGSVGLNNPFADDMETQRRLDAEFRKETVRDRRRRTTCGVDIRCSEAYNMAW